MFVITVALVIAPPSDPMGEETKDARSTQDLARFQGTWHVVAVELQGRRMNGIKAAQFDMVVDGTEVRFPNSGEGPGGVISVDATTEPKSLDIEYSTEGATLSAIYKLDGDELTLCFPRGAGRLTNRPEQFKTDADGTLEIRVYKKAKE